MSKKSKSTKPTKPKLTKEERRVKYTQKARDKRAQRTNRHLICFQCRRKGHTVANCPNATTTALGSKEKGPFSSFSTKLKNNLNKTNNRICYKCGKSDHPLRLCPHLTVTEKSLFPPADQRTGRSQKVDYSKMDLPYATCFVCGGKGHLSSSCTQNEKGLYVNGGSCRICGSRDHLVVHCPKKKKGRECLVINREEEAEEGGEGEDGVDVEEFLEEEGANWRKKSVVSEERKIVKERKRKVVKF